ncbi:unnamed protein product, partial [Heterosigma akashiwo]
AAAAASTSGQPRRRGRTACWTWWPSTGLSIWASCRWAWPVRRRWASAAPSASPPTTP